MLFPSSFFPSCFSVGQTHLLASFLIQSLPLPSSTISPIPYSLRLWVLELAHVLFLPFFSIFPRFQVWAFHSNSWGTRRFKLLRDVDFGWWIPVFPFIVFIFAFLRFFSFPPPFFSFPPFFFTFPRTTFAFAFTFPPFPFSFFPRPLSSFFPFPLCIVSVLSPFWCSWGYLVDRKSCLSFCCVWTWGNRFFPLFFIVLR